MHVQKGQDLDLLNEDVLYEWYHEVGGKHASVNFWYVLAGMSMENGLRSCNGDIGIIDFVQNFKGLGMATIYVEEINCEPLVVIDTQGNLVFSQTSENEDGAHGNCNTPDFP